MGVLDVDGISYSVTISLDDIQLTNTRQRTKITRSKGQSIIDFPKDFTVIDLETTGLVPSIDRILEVGAIRVRNNIPVQNLSFLIRPINDTDISVPYFVTDLTGITETEIRESGLLPQTAVNEFLDFIGTDFLMGYNTSFDINFLYDLIKSINHTNFKNNYIDVMRIARKALPDLKHHRLKDLIKYFNIPIEQKHRSLSDCSHTLQVFEKLEDLVESKDGIDLFLSAFHKKHNHRPDVQAKDITTNNITFDETNPFFQENVCFTGKMDSLIRKEAMQLIKDIGGVPQDRVTTKTDFLVLGDTSLLATVKDGVTGKLKKAHDFMAQGFDISVISETVFLDMLHEENRGE